MEFLKNISRFILKKEIDAMKKEIDVLNSKIEELMKNQCSEKENELNSKYPKVNLEYLRIETDGRYNVPLQNFFTPYDFNIPIIEGQTDDEKALLCLQWVIKNIKYVSDKTTYGYGEYWAYPYQTLKRKCGDCEDGAILLANIMLKSGIPYWKIRITAGDVDDGKGNKGGHAFVVYYCEEEDKFVILDWCFWPDKDTKIKDRKDYKDENYYKTIWFSFNEKYSFSNKDFKTDVNFQIKKKKKK